MKLLFLSAFYPPHVGGGAELILQRSVEGFQARGLEVAVLVTGPEKGLSQEHVNGVRVYRAGLSNLYWHYTQERPGALTRLGWHMLDRYNHRMQRPLRKVLAQEQPDLVVCHNLAGWSISAWSEIQAAGIPVVQVLHDMYLLCPRSTKFNKGQSCVTQCGTCKRLRQPHPKASQQLAAVIGVSRYLLDSFLDQNYFSTATHHVIHNSCLVTSAPALEEKPYNQTLRFGYMGTLSENKGVSWLIKQFQRLNLDATLTIAGRGQLEYEAELKALADPHRVRFIGYQTPEAFYKEIDVSVVPSRWAEPFGMVAVEACAHHVPVIATRMGGLPEIIMDQVNGLLCDPADENSLGNLLQKIHDDTPLRERLTRQARESVKPMLSIDSMLDEYQSIFKKTLANVEYHHG